MFYQKILFHVVFVFLYVMVFRSDQRVWEFDGDNEFTLPQIRIFCTAGVVIMVYILSRYDVNGTPQEADMLVIFLFQLEGITLYQSNRGNWSKGTHLMYDSFQHFIYSETSVTKPPLGKSVREYMILTTTWPYFRGDPEVRFSIHAVLHTLVELYCFQISPQRFTFKSVLL